MSQHFADRMTTAVAEKGTAACVGIDPVYANLPAALRAEVGEADAVAALRVFSHRVLATVADLVAVVKINIAFFERYRGPGVALYFELIARARELGLIVIGDVKRGDIGHTSAAYARAQLADGDAGVGPDAVTLSGYLGSDGISPFMEVCRAQGKGLFVLVHTSNASARELQHAELRDGSNVAERMAGLVDTWAHAEGMVGDCGLSAVGAVVAPGDMVRAQALRAIMPDSVFLVPGFGAQGRGVAHVAACFRAAGGGALVNSSRGVIFAYEEPEYAAAAPDQWDDSVRRACKDLVKALAAMNPTEPRP